MSWVTVWRVTFQVFGRWSSPWFAAALRYVVNWRDLFRWKEPLEVK
jgi:hypothetical protein